MWRTVGKRDGLQAPETQSNGKRKERKAMKNNVLALIGLCMLIWGKLKFTLIWGSYLYLIIRITFYHLWL